ncbi:MAG: hypothetical protein SFY92_12640 [Verrucomicrobiae bacterium]|nr:hypothetical protein [Verrucomicrobiae bacterium]
MTHNKKEQERSALNATIGRTANNLRVRVGPQADLRTQIDATVADLEEKAA